MYLSPYTSTAVFMRENGDMSQFRDMSYASQIVWKYTVAVENDTPEIRGLYHRSHIYYDDENDWYTMFMYLGADYDMIAEVRRFYDFEEFTRLGYKIEEVKTPEAFSRLFHSNN